MSESAALVFRRATTGGGAVSRAPKYECSRQSRPLPRYCISTISWMLLLGLCACGSTRGATTRLDRAQSGAYAHVGGRCYDHPPLAVHKEIIEALTGLGWVLPLQDRSEVSFLIAAQTPASGWSLRRGIMITIEPETTHTRIDAACEMIPGGADVWGRCATDLRMFFEALDALVQKEEAPTDNAAGGRADDNTCPPRVR